MKINAKKYELARARACMGLKELEAAGISRGTLSNIRKRNLKPKTIGRIAAALGVDVTEIIDMDENDE